MTQYGLTAVFEPVIDERKLDREVSKAEKKLEELETIEPDIQTAAVGDASGATGGASARRTTQAGAASLAGNAASGMAAGRGAAAATSARAGAAASSSSAGGLLAAGGTASTLGTVALGGALAVGIGKGISTIASASPAWNKTADLFGEAMNLFFRPFGNFLGESLRPVARDLLEFTKDFSQVARSDGLMVGIEWLSSNAVSAFANAFGDILGGHGSLGDWLVAGLGTVAVTKLVSGASLTSLVTGTSITSLVSGTGISSLLSSATTSSVLTSVGAGTLFTAVSAGAVLTGISAAAIIGSVALSDLITGADLTFDWGNSTSVPAFLDPETGTVTTPNNGVMSPEEFQEQYNSDTGNDGDNSGGGADSIADLSNQQIVDRLDSGALTPQQVVDAVSAARVQDIAAMTNTGIGGNNGGGGGNTGGNTGGNSGGNSGGNNGGGNTGGGNSGGEDNSGGHSGGGHTGGGNSGGNNDGSSGGNSGGNDESGGGGGGGHVPNPPGYGGGGQHGSVGRGDQPGYGLAEGGVVTNETQATIGEAGPEAVIPLRDMQRMFGQTDAQAAGDSGLTRAQLDELASRLERKFDALIATVEDGQGDVVLKADTQELARASDSGRNRFDTTREITR